MPGGGLPVTHPPLNRIPLNKVVDPFDFAKMLEEFLENLPQQILDWVIPVIKDVTGVDLSGLEILADGLRDLLVQAFNIPSYIPATHIGAQIVELLQNPTFDTINSLVTGGGWDWDSTRSHAAGCSATNKKPYGPLGNCAGESPGPSPAGETGSYCSCTARRATTLHRASGLLLPGADKAAFPEKGSDD